MSRQGDNYRPNFGSGCPPPPIPDSAREAMFSLNGVRNTGSNRGRWDHNRPRPNRGGRDRRDRDRDRRGYGAGQYQRYPRGASSRPLLMQSTQREEQVLRDTSAADRFRNLDDITDSEEDNMDESEEESDDDRPTKKAKTADADSPAAANLPKWSNPDPYTALPPVAEGTGKRINVLKLIRKAKIDDAKPKDAIKESEDFISFGGMDEDDEEDDNEDDDEHIPKGPRGYRSRDEQYVPPQVDGPGLDSLGKRKRGQKSAMPRPPHGYLPSDQLVLEAWRPRSSDDATPWFQRRQSQDSAGIALHKEVIDFFDWVKPQDYEREVRADVVRRLNMVLQRVETGELKAFGSYAAGLYLPVGDMDLVYITSKFRPGKYGANGLPPPISRKLLGRYHTLIKTYGLAVPDSIKLIPWAKVPIIKFTEARSKLQVDLSFDNDTGITAVETFQAWKTLHPTVPILVSVIKQFLMIRGLNDVAIGGLGGFSIICLVTSLLQHMPGAGANSNVGQVLVEFFNLYGYLLDRQTVAIRMDPPGYIDKASYKPMLVVNEKRERLTIIDPNRPENNISGGTHLINKIIDAFAQAHDLLLDRLTAYEKGDTDVSFLQDLVGGDFTPYDRQRRQLADLYFGLTGQDPLGYGGSGKAQRTNGASRTLTATSSEQTDEDNSSVIEVAVPNLRRSKRQKANTASAMPKELAGLKPRQQKKALKLMKPGQRRAIRLKICRPELASRIPDKISIAQAVDIGGYEDSNAYAKDMENIEHGQRGW